MISTEQRVLVVNQYIPGKPFDYHYGAYDDFMFKELPDLLKAGWIVKHLIENDERRTIWCLIERHTGDKDG